MEGWSKWNVGNVAGVTSTLMGISVNGITCLCDSVES